MERYRSGHNEAVLKTVCPQGRVGSNPTLSADDIFRGKPIIYYIWICSIWSSNLEKYPSWPKGHPWKGCRSLTAARGFKSLLLRWLFIEKEFDKKTLKKLLTNEFWNDNIIWLTENDKWLSESKKLFKKLLTQRFECDILNKLLLRQQRTLITEQRNNLERF